MGSVWKAARSPKTTRESVLQATGSPASPPIPIPIPGGSSSARLPMTLLRTASTSDCRRCAHISLLQCWWATLRFGRTLRSIPSKSSHGGIQTGL
jgi:hypothetical protein